MAFTVQLYQFAKKQNSTAFPPAELNPFTFEGTLREGTSILAPSFGFDFGPGGKQAETTFLGVMPTWALVAAPFSRCYFINDWSYEDGLWWASMTVDVLATYKVNIGSYEGYILRSTNNLAWDRRAIDTTYPTVGGLYNSYTQMSDYWQKWGQAQGLPDAPCYIIGVVNNATNTMRRGGIAYYMMTESELRKFMQVLFSSISYANLSTEDLSESVAKILLNPTQYITSLTWFPSTIWAASMGDENLSSLPFGWWSLDGVNCKTIQPSLRMLVDTRTVTIPKHPQSNEYPYTQLPPYSSYVLRIPPWGEINIEPGILYGRASISVAMYCDAAATFASLVLLDEDGGPLARYDGRIGVDLPLASMTIDQDIKSIATQQVATIGSQVFQGLANADNSAWENLQTNVNRIADKIGAPHVDVARGGREIAQTAANIGTAIAAKFITVSSSDIASAVSVYSEPAYMRLDYFNMADTNDADFGRPAMRTKVISTIPGLVKVADSHIKLTATATEVDSVNQYMRAGFWYE